MLHTILAVSAVAASTHLVVWLVRVLRGNAGRLAAVRRFAIYAAVLHLGAFVAGNLMYPTYKVRVKVQYLQDPQEVIDEGQDRLRAARTAERRHTDRSPPPPTEGELARATTDLPEGAEKIARWFDAKEHWVAMGLALSIGLAFLLRLWTPKDGGAVTPIVMTFALGACFTLWFGAIVGVLTASWRAVG